LICDGGEYPINITDPFTPQEEQRLEWYFEEWLIYPMLNGKKAEAAKTSVVSYGESLFNQVFKADIDAYAYYRQLRGNLKQVKIEIVGNSHCDAGEFRGFTGVTSPWFALTLKPVPLRVGEGRLERQFKAGRGHFGVCGVMRSRLSLRV
jgi:hypothetical protein